MIITGFERAFIAFILWHRAVWNDPHILESAFYGAIFGLWRRLELIAVSLYSFFKIRPFYRCAGPSSTRLARSRKRFAANGQRLHICICPARRDGLPRPLAQAPQPALTL